MNVNEHLRKVFASICPEDECPDDPTLAIDCLVEKIIHLRHVCAGVDIRMRPFDQIQRAHDMLVAILKLEIVKGIVPDEKSRTVVGGIDLLCWVLVHDHNTRFADELRVIEQYLRDAKVMLNGSSFVLPDEKPN
jgi:hypothetical protein